jgi:glycolate oxidase iron-sulfur subunit
MKKRVALLAGCAQQVVTPQVNEATIRLLTRLGCEVVVARGAGCCGALVHHMGREADAMAAAKANIAAWERAGPFDAVIANASGCGTQLKEYGFLLRNDPEWAPRAAELSAKARDISEVVAEFDIAETRMADLPTVAYHSACSLQHGQRITSLPREQLVRAGFEVSDIPEGHICCGSAGTYNLTQPELSTRLLERKVGNILKTGAEVVAAGNVGCMVQIASGLDRPVVHPVELLDWATGGPRPKALSAGA